MSLYVRGCLPGYRPSKNTNNNEELCACDMDDGDIVRCDDNLRYLYLRVWMHSYTNSNDLVCTCNRINCWRLNSVQITYMLFHTTTGFILAML